MKNLTMDKNLGINSKGGEDYFFTVGAGDVTDSATLDHADGAYFKYDRSTSANWIAVTADDGTTTATTTSLAVAVDTWMRINIEVNADATSVEFSVDDVVLATHTANIPDSADDLLDQVYKLKKTAGSAARKVYIDYHMNKTVFTTAR